MIAPAMLPCMPATASASSLSSGNGGSLTGAYINRPSFPARGAGRQTLVGFWGEAFPAAAGGEVFGWALAVFIPLAVPASTNPTANFQSICAVDNSLFPAILYIYHVFAFEYIFITALQLLNSHLSYDSTTNSSFYFQ